MTKRRFGACEGCRRHNTPISRHHLVPRAREDKWARKARSMDKDRNPLRITVWLCDICHDLIHKLFTVDQLKDMPKEQQLGVLENRPKALCQKEEGLL